MIFLFQNMFLALRCDIQHVDDNKRQKTDQVNQQNRQESRIEQNTGFHEDHEPLEDFVREKNSQFSKNETGFLSVLLTFFKDLRSL